MCSPANARAFCHVGYHLRQPGSTGGPGTRTSTGSTATYPTGIDSSTSPPASSSLMMSISMLKLGIPGGLPLPFPGTKDLCGQFLDKCPTSLQRKHFPLALSWAISCSDKSANFTDFLGVPFFFQDPFGLELELDIEFPFLPEGCAEPCRGWV